MNGYEPNISGVNGLPICFTEIRTLRYKCFSSSQFKFEIKKRPVYSGRFVAY